MASLNGNTITASFNLTSKVCSEIEALYEQLSNLFTSSINQLATETDTPWLVAAGPVEDWSLDDSGWLNKDALFALPLKSKGKGNRKIQGHLGFQISLAGDGVSIPGYNEPLLHVFLWTESEEPNFEEGHYQFFPIPDDESAPFEILSNRLVHWGDSDGTWDEKAWTFSLKIFDLATIDDLHHQVIKPMIALLSGAPAEEALPDSLSALVCYPEKAQLVQLPE